jgi:hypothetical protein
MSLRNELRQPLTNWTLLEESYNWETWYQYTKLGADAVHASNPDPLIFLSGMDSSTQFDRIVRGQTFTPSTATFSKADFDGYADKLALEMHSYSILDSDKPKDCPSFEKKLHDKGFETLTDSAANQFPLLMTEFGFTQDETTWKTDKYATCITDYLPQQKVGWFIWVIAGSYYIREGDQGYDESWGLLDTTWSEWRSPEFVGERLKGMVNTTLDVVRSDGGEGGEEGSENGPGKNADGSNSDGQTEAGPGSQAGENTAVRSTQGVSVGLAWLALSILLFL